MKFFVRLLLVSLCAASSGLNKVSAPEAEVLFAALVFDEFLVTLLISSVSWMMSYRKVTVRHFAYMLLKLMLKVLRLSLTSWWREGFVWNKYEELKCISSGKTDNLLLHNVIFSEKTHIPNPCRISRVKLMSPVFKYPFFQSRTIKCMPYRSLLIWWNWQ